MAMTGEMAVLNHEGDTRLIWDKDNPPEVAAARQMWNDLVVRGKYRAFRVKRKGDQGEPMTEFDPNAEKVILVPPLVGG